MAIDSAKLNLFGQSSGFNVQPAVRQVRPVGEKKSPEVASGGSPFAATVSNSKLFNKDKTVGVNTNIGVGDKMNIPAQAGRKDGSGTTLAFA